MKMRGKVLLSIIIPCFNDGKYLVEALGCIEKIKEIDHEVIIVDDGSKDIFTLKYLNELEVKNYRIIRQEHRGVSAARNLGIASASGSYILPLDADNIITSRFVEKGLEVLKDNPDISVFYCDQNRFGNMQGVCRAPFDIASLITVNCIDTCSIFRREVWESCGGYDENMVGLEDWELWLRAYERGFKFYHLPEPLVYYRTKSCRESLNAFCQQPENHSSLLSYIYSKHAILIRNMVLSLQKQNHELEKKLMDRKPFFGYFKNYIKKVIFKPKKKTISKCFNRKQEIIFVENGFEKLNSNLRNYSDKCSGCNNSRVSVVICTFNRWEHIKELLKALENQSYDDFEIIVVNGPSTDSTCRVRELYPTIKYTEAPEGNVSVARNIGIKMSSGDYVVFTDDDALPVDNDWILRFVRSFEADVNIKAAVGTVKSGWSERYEFYRAFISSYGRISYIWPGNDTSCYEEDRRSATRKFPFETGQGSNFAVKRKELLEAGGFDENYNYFYDEADLLCRLEKKGFRIVNVRKNIQRHFRSHSALRGSGNDLNWSLFARSTSYFGMKNATHLLPVKLLGVADSQVKGKAREIVTNYKEKKISFIKMASNLADYCKGGAAGVAAGAFKKRKLLQAEADRYEFQRFKDTKNKYAEAKIVNRESEKGFKIAVVAPRSPEGHWGGAERFHVGLTDALNRPGTHANLIHVSVDESSFESIFQSYLRCYELDLSEYDAVVSTKAPTHVLRHPKHICYHQHTIRTFYDMFDQHAAIIENRSMFLMRDLIVRTDTEAFKNDGLKKIFSQGYEIQKRLLFWNKTESEVLYPGLCLDCNPPGKYDYIFMPGRLHPWKRVELVIKAMQYVSHPLKLKITGTGEDEIRLKELAGSNDRIEFLGHVSDKQLCELYADSLVVPFVPVREDFGYVTLEAFGHEKPVITCIDSGEPVRFVKNNINGFVVTPYPRAIGRAIDFFANNPLKAKEMGKMGRSGITHINWNRVSKKIMEALDIPVAGQKKDNI